MKTIKPYIPTVICIIAIYLLSRTILFIGYVPTESMEPTIRKGSFILGMRIYGELLMGDIIIFEKDGQILVKRIAKTAGELVEHSGVPVTVPVGYFYVLGDNGDHSYDSRYWQEPFVEKDQVLAKVIWFR